MSTHNNMKKYIYIETKWRSNSNIKSSIQTYKQTNQTVLAQCNEKSFLSCLQKPRKQCNVFQVFY